MAACSRCGNEGARCKARIGRRAYALCPGCARLIRFAVETTDEEVFGFKTQMAEDYRRTLAAEERLQELLAKIAYNLDAIAYLTQQN